MTRLTISQLLRIDAALSDRDREIVELVARFGVASAQQLESIFFADPGLRSGARLARATLNRLATSGLLARLERRIGGMRAGSAGYIYRLGPQGRRLISYWSGQGLPRGRRPHEPGRLFVRHGLAVVDLYARLLSAHRGQRLELLAFDPEPDCWRATTSAFGAPVLLKPDAYARVALGAFEDRYFLEVDLASESRTTLLRKARTYVDYYRSGAETAEGGVFPRVLWVATTQRRVDVLTEVCDRLGTEADLFGVVTFADAVDLIAAGIESEAGGAV